MEFSQLLQEIGVDEQATLARFGGMASILKKFLLAFPKDPTFETVRDAWESGDEQKMELAVHTLKGVTGNLGMTPLFLLCTDGVNHLRGKEKEYYAEDMEKIAQEYQRVCACISQFGQ